MEFRLHPFIKLHKQSNDVLVAPQQFFLDIFNRSLKLNRFKIVYVRSEFSSILCHISQSFTDLDIMSGFIAFQLITFLEKAHISLIILKHGLTQCEDAREVKEYNPKALKQTTKEPTVSVYSSNIEPFLEDLTRFADDASHFEDGPKYLHRLLGNMCPRIRNQAQIVGILMMWFWFIGCGNHCDTINPMLFEFPRQKRSWPIFVRADLLSRRDCLAANSESTVKRKIKLCTDYEKSHLSQSSQIKLIAIK